MRVAIIGSRELHIDLVKYLFNGITLIVSGGVKGIDACAEIYADKHNIPKLIFLPDYKKYGKQAPLLRNKLIVKNCDIVYAFWNGVSRGTKYTIDYAKSIGIEVKLYLIKD